MTISVSPTRKLHWNYFIALERDLEVISRYIEFSTANFQVYSIELARLLFAAASEVDVVAKLLCEIKVPKSNADKITQYYPILTSHFPNLINTEVFVPRYGLVFQPWSNWTASNSPGWWKAYNKVKHTRDVNFHKATLQNALNALGALLILTFQFHAEESATTPIMVDSLKKTMATLLPESSLMRLDSSYYYEAVVV